MIYFLTTGLIKLLYIKYKSTVRTLHKNSNKMRRNEYKIPQKKHIDGPNAYIR